MEFITDPYFALVSLGKGEHCQWLNTKQENLLFWRLELESPDGTAPLYSNLLSKYNGVSLQRQEDRLILEVNWLMDFSPQNQGQVTMKIEFQLESPLSYWFLRVSPPKDWRIHRVDFPVFLNMPKDGATRFIAPKCWGMEYLLEEGFIYEEIYPAWSAFQMIAFTQGNNGFYAAAHDPDANQKTPVVKAGADTFSWYFEHIPELRSYNELPFELNYPMAVGVFHGEYYQAAQIYRKFSLKTQWGSQSHFLDRKFPPWLQDIDVSFLVHGASEAEIEALKSTLDYYNFPALLHGYYWHEIEFDTFYPEYFPAIEGFKKAVKEVRKKNGYVMPYINGRLWDPATRSWQEKEAFKYAVRKLDGRSVTEIYPSGALNNVMCPATEFWQNTVKSVTTEIFKEFNTDGVYIDQLSAAYAVPCYNTSHPHSPGGGNYWHEGYRRMLDNIREDIPVEAILSSEDGAECWIDLIDVHLMVNAPINGKRIPLFPAIYSDRVILLASEYFRRGDIEEGYPFRIKNMRAFLWGAIPGWISTTLLMDNINEADFLRKMVRVRRQAKEVLWGGRFLGMIEFAGENAVIETTSLSRSVEYQIKEKAVQGSLWQAPDGNYGVLIVNISNIPHDVQFFLPENLDIQRVIQYDAEEIEQILPVSEGMVSVKILVADSLFLFLRTTPEREE